MSELSEIRLLDPVAATITIESGTTTMFPVLLQHNAGHDVRVEITTADGIDQVVVASGVPTELGEVWR